MTQLPILKFTPLFQSVVWGGSRLQSHLNKDVSKDDPIGESWEMVDLPIQQSIVSGGPFDGVSLETIIQEHNSELLGTAKLLGGRFPLLFKYIDAQQTLSVQVHPDGRASRELGEGARPKTEAWYIIDCEKDAVLYVGLKPEVTRERFAAALEDGTVADLLHKVKVKPGDYFYLSAGTVHAIGEGILLAEVQQSSNTTYRVFDWNRKGMDGKPRPLHVEQALESIDYEQVGPPTYDKPITGRKGIHCKFFSMQSVTPQAGLPVELFDTGLIVLMGVQGSGSVTVKAGDSEEQLALGETLLVPACISERVKIKGDGNLTCMATSIPRRDTADSMYP